MRVIVCPVCTGLFFSKNANLFNLQVFSQHLINVDQIIHY